MPVSDVSEAIGINRFLETLRIAIFTTNIDSNRRALLWMLNRVFTLEIKGFFTPASVGVLYI